MKPCIKKNDNCIFFHLINQIDQDDPLNSEAARVYELIPVMSVRPFQDGQRSFIRVIFLKRDVWFLPCAVSKNFRFPLFSPTKKRLPAKKKTVKTASSLSSQLFQSYFFIFFDLNDFAVLNNECDRSVIHVFQHVFHFDDHLFKLFICLHF